jgi:hypothetical protein
MRAACPEKLRWRGVRKKSRPESEFSEGKNPSTTAEAARRIHFGGQSKAEKEIFARSELIFGGSAGF